MSDPHHETHLLVELQLKKCCGKDFIGPSISAPAISADKYDSQFT
jgi:hypothetical protein